MSTPSEQSDLLLEIQRFEWEGGRCEGKEHENRVRAADCLRQTFELQFDDQLERYLEVSVQKLIGDEYFSSALAECRDMHVAGLFFGSITLCQSVAEGLARFVAENSGMRPPGSFEETVDKLQKRNLIPEYVAKALLRIHGNDRNDFHHLRKSIQQEYRKLRLRSKECLANLFIVEAWVFECRGTADGLIQPVRRKFWKISADGHVQVYVRFQ